MTKRYLPLLAWFAVAGLPSGAPAQPVGPEFQVNTYTTNGQGGPSVASGATGNFVVVWNSYGQDGYTDGIFGQRYDSGGNPQGPEFQVNTYTTVSQKYPSVASDASGNFVVVWSSWSQDGSGYGVFGQRWDSGGNRVGGEFQVNTFTENDQTQPAVASDANGNFIVAWDSGFRSPHRDIYGQRYDSDGNRLGDEFQVNTYTTLGDFLLPSVASDSSGNFVVVWWSYNPDSNLVLGQRYDNNGDRRGGEFQVNTFKPAFGYQIASSVASDPSGNFVVVWEADEDGSRWGIFGQRYDSSGDRLGGEFQVNTHTADVQLYPSVALDASGKFVVVWNSQEQDGDAFGVFGQRYDSNGNLSGSEFQVNTYTTNGQSSASVGSDASGNFVVAWSGAGQGDDSGVFGQRFSAGCEAAVQVQDDVHTPGSNVAIHVHIAHRRPKTVTVPWELRLLDADGQRIVKHTTAPHTFEPGDVMDRNVEFRLPDDLAAGTYTLELAISGMAGTKGATTTLRSCGQSNPAARASPAGGRRITSGAALRGRPFFALGRQEERRGRDGGLRPKQDAEDHGDSDGRTPDDGNSEQAQDGTAIPGLLAGVTAEPA